ncbi:MAG TPA: stress response translation initiation inhibitor YciH [Baekduia sp.]|nr:stress response translation initiation inhibitor YciH [Baekduia sp.]
MAKRSGSDDMVWSSTDGDLRRARDPKTVARKTDGPVKVRRETAGRKGKTVTTVFNLPLNDVEIRELAGKLKKRCGVGGSSKAGIIEIQGDHRDMVLEVLRAEGLTAVLAGG